MKNIKSSPLKSFSYLVTSRIFFQLFTFLKFTIILRYFDPTEYGKVSLFLTIIGIFQIFVSFTKDAKARFGREEFDSSRKVNETYWAIVFIKSPFVIILIILAFIFKNNYLLFTKLNNDSFIILIIFFLFNIFAVNEQLLNAQERFKEIAFLKLIDVLIGIFTIVSFISGLFSPYVIILIFFNISIEIVREIVTLYLLRKQIFPVRINKKWMYMIFMFSLPFFLYILGSKTTDFVDTIVNRAFLNMKDVGIYSVAYRLRTVVFIPIAMIGQVIQPKIISSYIRPSDKYKLFYKKTMPVIGLFLLIIILISLNLIPLGVLIVGKKYEASIRPFLILLIPILSYSFNIMMLPLFIASKKIYPHIISTMSIAIINTILDIILIPHIGIIGGAVATVIASIISFFIYSIYFYIIFKINLIKYFIYNVIFMGVVSLFYLEINLILLNIVIICVISALLIFSKLLKMHNKDGMRFITSIVHSKKIKLLIEKMYVKLI